jgi:hypothetical protein
MKQPGFVYKTPKACRRGRIQRRYVDETLAPLMAPATAISMVMWTTPATIIRTRLRPTCLATTAGSYQPLLTPTLTLPRFPNGAKYDSLPPTWRFAAWEDRMSAAGKITRTDHLPVELRRLAANGDDVRRPGGFWRSRRCWRKPRGLTIGTRDWATVNV